MVIQPTEIKLFQLSHQKIVLAVTGIISVNQGADQQSSLQGPTRKAEALPR